MGLTLQLNKRDKGLQIFKNSIVIFFTFLEMRDTVYRLAQLDNSIGIIKEKLRMAKWGATHDIELYDEVATHCILLVLIKKDCSYY